MISVGLEWAEEIYLISVEISDRADIKNSIKYILRATALSFLYISDKKYFRNISRILRD